MMIPPPIPSSAETTPANVDPGPDRQQDRVPRALRRAEAVLGQGRAVGVVVDEDGDADALAHQVPDRHVRDLEVDGVDRDPTLAVDRAGDAEPGADHLRPRLHRLAQLLLDGPHHLVLAAPGRGLAAGVEDVLLGVDDPGGELGSAEVYAYRLAAAQDRSRSRGLIR